MVEVCMYGGVLVELVTALRVGRCLGRYISNV